MDQSQYFESSVKDRIRDGHRKPGSTLQTQLRPQQHDQRASAWFDLETNAPLVKRAHARETSSSAALLGPTVEYGPWLRTVVLQ
jgi:hypothetical protein